MGRHGLLFSGVVLDVEHVVVLRCTRLKMMNFA